MESNQNPWSAENASGRQVSEMPKVGAPPVEVAIRTMASDIASIGQSGGGPPKAETVTLPSFRQEEINLTENKESRRAEPEMKVVSEKLSNILGAPAFKYFLLAGSILVGAAVVFLISYYVLYPLIGRLKSATPAAVSAPTSTEASTRAGQGFEHRSFFTQAVDGTFPLKISSSNAGFEGSGEQSRQFLAGLASSSTFFEIEAQSSDGKALAANDFFSLINGGVLEESFLVFAFNPDFTVFLYKDKKGLPAGPFRQNSGDASQTVIWPGYIFQLKTGQTPLLLQPMVAKIESASSNWENLFLQSPGNPAAAFRDALVSGQPVRVLDFSDGKSVLVYGWLFNKYLIISTSLEGMKQAIQHF
ncbi:MAG: hypothetical protein HY433_03755 [Candidatus Liptonbacteria bacterium]|nr:hypothetical protein [Candidatus Liptonbacteria bacterium]